MVKSLYNFSRNIILILLTGIFLFGISCQSGDSDQDFRREQYNRERESRQSSGCRNRSSDGEVRINNAEDIYARNAGQYSLTGQCGVRETEVEIRIETQSVKESCSGGRWSAKLDVTSVVQGRESVSISVQSGRNTACVSVENHFLCPDDYIPVPELKGYTEDSFCVMKYEARRENRRNSRSSDRGGQRYRDDIYDPDYLEEQRERYYEKAISHSRDEPWTGIFYDVAKKACRNNGIGYHLISNHQWQTIARHIESKDENWSFGISNSQEGNIINKGKTTDSQRYRGSASRWSVDRPFHILPNEEMIEDFSGSVWEIILDTPSELGVVKGSNTESYQLRDRNKDLFGPARNYSTQSRNRTGMRDLGLGYAKLSDVKNVILRGGASYRDAGIFSVDTTMDEGRLSRNRDVGFRCVYNF